MRWLVGLVWVMGVLIVLGVATVAVTIVTRFGPGTAAPAGTVVLDEPAGTHIAGVAALGDRLTVTLSGGGPDRVAIIDLRRGTTVAHVSLKR
jgi:hypothetical protein